MYQVIQIHSAAPKKPPEHEPCNGCGVCCASEPCPLGVLVSRRRYGACDALVWLADAKVYRCGLIEQPQKHLYFGLHWLAPLLQRIAHRYIAAGSGCDCSITVERRA